jgi:Flp pilus assembly protein TadG
VRKSAKIRSRRQRGQSLVETMLMLVLVFAVIFWVFEIGWLMYTFTVMADAANEGVRYCIAHSGGDADGTVETKVKSFADASLHDVSAIQVTVTPMDGNYNPPNRVSVKVTYQFVPWLTQYLPDTYTMTTYAEGRMVVQ